MNPDTLLITSLLKRGTLEHIIKAKAAGIIPEDMEQTETRKALAKLYYHAQEYREIIPADVLVKATGVDLVDSPMSPDAAIDTLLEKKLYQKLQLALHDATTKLDDENAKVSFEAIDGSLREIRKTHLVSSPISSMFALGPEVEQEYEDVKAGKMGILTRWPAINDATLGFWPQDLVLVVARVSTGKTWSSIIIAHDAWAGIHCEWDGMTLKTLYRKECIAEELRQKRLEEDRARRKAAGEPEPKPPEKPLPPACVWLGPSSNSDDVTDKCPKCGGKVRRKGYRVLYITTEISKRRIAGRFYAVRNKLPYKAFRRGNLSKDKEAEFKKAVYELRDHEGLYVVGGDFDFTAPALEAAIEESQPDMMVLDGAYLIKAEGKSRTEMAANVFNDLKRLLHRHQITGVITSQLNRQANTKDKSTVNTETIALTDAAGWNSDVVVGMIQSEDDKAAKRMFFKPLKVREGEGKEIELIWDFTTMTFDELPETSPMGGGEVSDSDDSGFSSDDVPF